MRPEGKVASEGRHLDLLAAILTVAQWAGDDAEGGNVVDTWLEIREQLGQMTAHDEP